MPISTVKADKLASLNDFLAHSKQLMDECGLSPLAVLSDNKPVFYVLTPESWERFSLQLRDQQIGFLNHVQPVAMEVPMIPISHNQATRVVKVTKDAFHDQRAFEKQNNFNYLANELLSAEWDRVSRGELSASSIGIQKNRLDAHILPFFRYIPATQVTHQTLDDFVSRLTKQDLSTTTISQYLVIVRKLLKLGVRKGFLKETPEMPKVKIAIQPRSMLSVLEYRKVCKAANRLSQTRVQAPPLKSTEGKRERFWVAPRNMFLPPDMGWAIRFMVNSFIRPGDLRELKHKHVTVVRGSSIYLRLKLPKTKKHDKQMVTLQPAVKVYEAALSHHIAEGYGGDEDYVFLPAEKDRNYALAVLGFWFKWCVREAGLASNDELGQTRTLYCLRHTSLMFRLLYGQGIDMLTLARNARTSVQMIEKFYASSLDGEMNVRMLQSRRRVKAN